MRRYITILLCLLVFTINSVYANDINVTLINAEPVGDNKVLITWQDSGSNVTYNIYRSTNMLNSPQKIDSAVLITNVPIGIEKIIDTKITNSGNYYYGIAVVKNNIINKNLIEDASYTTIPVTIKIKKKKEPKPIVNINTNTNKVVKIEPKPEPEPKKEEKIETNVVITPPAPKVIKPKPIKKRIVKRKIKKKKNIKKEKRYIAYEKILRQGLDLFYKSAYNRAEKKFNFLIKSKAKKRIKNQAKLFLGKIYFYKKKYRKALVYFVKIKQIYPDETEFWINRTLNKIGE